MTIATKALQKNYSRLKPRERFAASFAANLRGDKVEALALRDTAPLRTWNIAEGYGLSTTLTLLALFHVAKLADLAVLLLRLMAIVEQEEEDAKCKPSRARKDAASLRIVAYTYGVRVAAWREFCAGLGIDPDLFLRWYAGGGAELAHLAELAEAIAYTEEEALAAMNERKEVGGEGLAILTQAAVLADYRAAFEMEAKSWHE